MTSKPHFFATDSFPGLVWRHYGHPDEQEQRVYTMFFCTCRSSYMTKESIYLCMSPPGPGFLFLFFIGAWTATSVLVTRGRALPILNQLSQPWSPLSKGRDQTRKSQDGKKCYNKQSNAGRVVQHRKEGVVHLHGNWGDARQEVAEGTKELQGGKREGPAQAFSCSSAKLPAVMCFPRSRLFSYCPRTDPRRVMMRLFVRREMRGVVV